jgi:hypothetical protein
LSARISILCLVLLTFANKVNAQLGYVRKGNLYIQGDVYDQGPYLNNRQLLFIEKTNPVTYTPSQIEEYGLIEGDVYIKRTVHDGQKTADYFLLRLVHGERTLYALKEKKGFHFFIERDSSLVDLKKGTHLKDQLTLHLKRCGSSQEIAASARYGATSLKRAVLLSNACYTGFFPRLRIGALTGYEFSSQSLGTIADHIFLKASSSSPVVGVFIDVPLGMSPSWFMTVQATYQQNNYNKYQADNNVTVEYQDNFATIGFPLLFKYRGSSSTWRPFIGLGSTPAIYWQQQNAWLSTTYVGSIAYLNQGSWDKVKKFQISGTLSAGLEYSVTPRNAVSLELRVKKLIDAQVGPAQSFALLTSFYF